MHYHVLGLNESSTEDDTKKAYCNLAHIFHPDKNQHSQASDVVLMINKAKKELEDALLHNYTIRGQEYVRMAQNTIEPTSSGRLHIKTRKFIMNQAVTYKVWLLG